MRNTSLTTISLFVASLTTSFLTACVDYNEVSRLVNVKIQLQAPNGFNASTDLANHDITIVNGTRKATATTDANGIATFPGILPDVYDISTSWDITGDEYKAATGSATAEEVYTVSASLNAQVLSEAEEYAPLQLKSTVAWKVPIVISKIYYAASKDKNNKNYVAGKYLELFNQTGVSVDLAGLYLGMLDSTNPQPFPLGKLKEDAVIQGNKVLVKQVFRIPTDKAYLLAPGQAAILTNSATNHSDVSPYEQDLTNAQFEAKDISGVLVNNPAVPALLTSYTSSGGSATMNLTQSGPCGIIIFRTDEDITTWDKTYGYGKTSGNQSYLLVPNDVIYDGVDAVKNKVNTGPDIDGKRLYEDIDAGYTFIEAISGWSGEVLYRRTERVTPDGRIILKDTNNSTNDFQVSKTVKCKEYDH